MSETLWKSDEHFINACNESYQQGKADGTKEFAEWFKKSNYYLCYSDTIDEVLAEWQKETENDRIRAKNANEAYNQALEDTEKEVNDSNREFSEWLSEHDAELLDKVYTELEKYKREINLANTPWNFIELVFTKMKADIKK